jgi:LCP family protein required for cell wall assembly
VTRRTDRPKSLRGRGSHAPRHAKPRHITPAPPSLRETPSTPLDPARAAPAVKPRRRLDRKARLLRTAVIFVALVLVLAGSGYGYLRYRESQIKTVACPSCAAAISGEPFNVLIIGDDSRADNTPAENANFGSTAEAGGAHSDTLKVAHVDPASGTVSMLSIPRDTYVQLSGLDASWKSQLGTSDQKINAALNDSVDSLVQTVQNSFGIPVQSWVLINFNGLMNAVQTVGGIKLDFRYPVRDDDDGNNNSGLSINQTGCLTLNGAQTLALSRSRFYQYELSPGVWEADGTGDLGRIQRQNEIIKALIDKAESTYNPFTLNAFVGSVVHDVRIGGLSSSELFSLALKYHGFSGSSLQTATIPTYGAGSAAGSVEVVSEPQAQQVITQFLGEAPDPATTPPLDPYGAPIAIPAASSSGTPASGAGSSGTASSASSSSGSATKGSTTALTQPALPSFDPTPC